MRCIQKQFVLLVSIGGLSVMGVLGYQGGSGEPIKTRPSAGRPANRPATQRVKGLSPTKTTRATSSKRTAVTRKTSVSENAGAIRSLTEGNQHLDNFDLDAAIAAFSHAIELSPKYAKAYYNRALARRQKGDEAGAITDYTSAFELDPTNSEILNNRGAIFATQMNFHAAIEDYTRAIDLYPLYLEAIATKNGQNYRLARSPAEGLDSRRIVPLDVTTMYLNRGNAYMRLNDIDAARADFSKALEIDGKSAKAYFLRGFAYLYSGNYDRAFPDCRQAQELDPTSVNARKCLLELSNAKAVYEKILNDTEGDATGVETEHQRLFKRGNAQMGFGRLGEAIADYTKAITTNPKFAFALLNRAYAYHAKKEFSLAINDLNSVISLNPTLSDAYMRRGLARFELGEIDLAIVDYARALDLSPRNGLVFIHRARAEIRKGNYEAAIGDLDRYIRFDPMSDYAYLMRARLHDQQGRPDMARADRALVRQRTPSQ